MDTLKVNPFKNSNGVLYTKSLFIEQSYHDTSNTMYTLGTENHPKGYVSLYKKYLEMDDPTEWTFANKYFDSWTHWEMLKKCSWFKPYAESWSKQLELKILSESLARLQREAKASTRDSFMANKFLVEKKWITPQDKKTQVGRPTKDAIKRQAQLLYDTQTRIEDDFDRVLSQTPKVN